MEIRTIVLTGGPCGGKSSVLAHLKEVFAADATFVDEAATVILQRHGLPHPTWGDREWEELQQRIIRTQLAWEQEGFSNARKYGHRASVCDRGLEDDAAYPMGEASLRHLVGPDRHNRLARYDLVLHLPSLAVTNPGRYELLCQGNLGRYESVAEAVEQENRTLAAWAGHPNRVILKSTSIEQLAQECVSYLRLVVLSPTT